MNLRAFGDIVKIYKNWKLWNFTTFKLSDNCEFQLLTKSCRLNSNNTRSFLATYLFLQKNNVSFVLYTQTYSKILKQSIHASFPHRTYV